MLSPAKTPAGIRAEPLVSLENVGVLRNGRWLVRGVDFSVSRGEIVTLIGPNGSGKSTSAKAAIGVLKPDEGRVERKAGLKVGYVPQKLSIDWTLPLSVRRLMTLTGPLPERDMLSALESAGIAHMLDAEVQHLSGGEFQRALMARAIARKPDLLVLDEPVQGVDFSGEIVLYDLIKSIRNATGCGILLISHDLHVVMAETDTVICLNGHVCCRGTPESVSRSPEYVRLFGSRAAQTLAVYSHHHDHTHLPDGRVQHADGTVTDHCHPDDGHHAHEHGHAGHEHDHDHPDHAHPHAHEAESAMLDDFFVRAILAGVGLALTTGPLGCFIIWRRMAYFGDTIAHSALLGVALSLLFELNLTLAVFAVAALVSVLLLFLQKRQALSADALLGILSHATLAIGLVMVAFMSWVRIDLIAFLFGDILAVSTTDIALIWGGGLFVLLAMAWLWRPLLAATVNAELAEAEGLKPERARLFFMLLMAVVIAIAMKIVGIMLITSLLIIPAAAARRFSPTPEIMAVLASLIGAAAVVGGLFGSLTYDTPSGPSIVVAALILFILSLLPVRRHRAVMQGQGS